MNSLKNSLPKWIVESALKEALAQKQTKDTGINAWPSFSEYKNRDTGKTYEPHSEQERQIINDNEHKNLLVKGGEGSGKSVCGIIRNLEKLRLGMSGIMASPDFEHFKRSIWPEFQRWCPWDCVVQSQRRRGDFAWEPNGPFALAFLNGAKLYCGGMDDPIKWEGPNVSFAHFDEARRAKTAQALKVLDGRTRIPGPNGERPQLWLTTTPHKHWLYDYFGPKLPNDPYSSFKDNSLTVTLLTRENLANLSPDYIDSRRSVLTEAEARVLLEAEWEDMDESTTFLPSMSLWDTLKETLPALTAREPLVIALDAGVSNDSFGLIGCTRHPARHEDVAVRYIQEWIPEGKLDFTGTPDYPGPELVMRMLCDQYRVVKVVYDPYQLHHFCSQMGRDGLAWFEEFPQTNKRTRSDKMLYDLIMGRRLAHDGDARLRQHIDNADRKLVQEEHGMRLVKRADGLKIDLAVSLSMAAFECLELNL